VSRWLKQSFVSTIVDNGSNISALILVDEMMKRRLGLTSLHLAKILQLSLMNQFPFGSKQSKSIEHWPRSTRADLIPIHERISLTEDCCINSISVSILAQFCLIVLRMEGVIRNWCG